MTNEFQVAQQVRLEAAAGLLITDQLQQLVNTYAKDFTYMELVNSEDRSLQRFDLSQMQAVERWSEGRLFGLDYDLRWRFKQGKWAVCLLSESLQSLPAVLPTLCNGLYQKSEVKVRLWGEHRAEDFDSEGIPFWFEAQIPRLLDYPVNSAPTFVAMRVAQYREIDGRVSFVRWITLEEW